MPLNQSIFRAYDVRGIYPEEINEKTAYQIGRAFAVYLKENETVSLRDISRREKKIAVGRDARLSSPVLSRSFISGIIDQGINVWDIGLSTVDMAYFASGYFNIPAAMVTASHNPKEYNGFKLMGKGANLIGLDSGLDEIKIIMESGETASFIKSGGKVIQEPIGNEYSRHVLSFAELDRIGPLKIAIDASSGSVGSILEKILKKLPVNYTAIHFNPNGNFPYHGPDPKKEKNLADLKNEVLARHYHFGCAFDGDGDRIIFVDEKGDSISPSIIGAIMARYFLAKTPHSKVIYTADASKIISDLVNKYGGEAVREKVGHTFINQRLRNEKGILGIETSGHYFFRNNFYADSGIISLIVMMNILSMQKKSLSILVSEFSKYSNMPEINFKVKDSESLIKKIAQNFKGYETDWLDGLTVTTSDFWFNLRPSNTEPLVRLNIEADNELILNRVKKELVSLIKQYSL